MTSRISGMASKIFKVWARMGFPARLEIGLGDVVPHAFSYPGGGDDGGNHEGRASDDPWQET